jgi:dihydrolipoamide dehydrogenase
METMAEFLPLADQQISRAAFRLYKKQGLDIRLEARLVSSEIKDKQAHVVYEDKTGEQHEVFDKLIVAVGRKPNSDLMFDAEMDIQLDERRFILVNDHCETSSPGVYAIGDVVRGPMLAHKASEEGLMVAERIAGQKSEINYDLVPNVVYTFPEVAWVGMTEQQCKQDKVPYKTGSFPMAASGRAKASNTTDGMIKIISNSETDRVIGVHMLCANASELISQAVTAMEMQSSTEDIQMTMFSHPSLSEAIHEAALAVDKRAIHVQNRK